MTRFLFSILGLFFSFVADAQWEAGVRDLGLSTTWWVAKAVENNDLSPTGGEAVLEHLARYGPPRAPEEAWRIKGLRKEEQMWLLGSTKWHQMCRTRPPQAPSLRGVYTSTHRRGVQREVARELRLLSGGVRGRVHIEDTLSVSGSWSRLGSSWSYVIGDHVLRWGQGLTVPRSDPFGLALFVGSSETKLSLPPSSAFHSDFQGAYRGVAAEKAGEKWDVGCSVGRWHQAAFIRRTSANQAFAWTGFRENQDFTWGVDWTGRWKHWDGQAAFARQDQSTGLRACMRTARADAWVFQLGADLSESNRRWQSEIRSFATWISPESGGQVQLRIRRRSSDGWDLRAQGRARRNHPVRWSVQCQSQERMVGCQYQIEDLRIHLWTGQGAEGKWTHARHIEWMWTGKSGGNWSAYVLDGRAPWEGAYVALPALDARQWSRAPESGMRMGIRCRSPKKSILESEWEWKGAWQFSWSPSQQETFRCAWRIRWQA